MIKESPKLHIWCSCRLLNKTHIKGGFQLSPVSDAPNLSTFTLLIASKLSGSKVKGQRSTTGEVVVTGFVVGVVNVLLTTLIWVVKIRLKLQGAKFRNEGIVAANHKGVNDAFHQITGDEGILS